MFLPAIAFTSSYYLARMADQGLAHAVGLATLRHGTNPLSWVGIHLVGPMPSMGRDLGARNEYAESMDCTNRFYMAHDSDYYSDKSNGLKSALYNRIEMRAIPKIYAVGGGWNLMGFDNDRRINGVCEKIFQRISLVIGAGIGLLVPTIKFRFTPDRIKTFKHDERMGDAGKKVACYTESWWSPLNIGLVGTIYNCLTYKTPIRMIKDPARVITGVAMLAISGAAAYAIMINAPVLLVTYKTAIIAGAIIAVI